MAASHKDNGGNIVKVVVLILTFAIKGVGWVCFFLVTIEEVLSNDFSLFGFGWKVQCLKLRKDFVDSETDYLTFTYL